MTEPEPAGCCEECGTRLYRAGERAPSGEYLRIDDESLQTVFISAEGSMPASFDGHIALYRAAAAPCVCGRSHAGRQPAIAPHDIESKS